MDECGTEGGTSEFHDVRRFKSDGPQKSRGLIVSTRRVGCGAKHCGGERVKLQATA